MPLLRDMSRSAGGGPDQRRSLADFRGLEALLAVPSAPNNNLHDAFEGGGCAWEGAGSPEPAQSPRALVPPNCFPPRHPRSFASFSETARPGTGWSDDSGTSTQGIPDIVSSLKGLALPPPPPQSNRNSLHLHLSYDGVENQQPESLWSSEHLNNNSDSSSGSEARSQALARRASFCGVLTSGGNGVEAARWKGVLPERCTDEGGSFSPKVFFGGLPYDVTEQTLMHSLRQFQPLRVEWPGPESSPRGFAYVTFAEERRVRQLLAACRYGAGGAGGAGGAVGWYYPLPCRKSARKEVQVIPWCAGDAAWARGAAARLQPQRTVFVGALHGMLTAAHLAMIMHDLFGGVLYAGIDTDKNKYPIGSGRVTFDNVRSYVRAVSARHVLVVTSRFSKRLQVDPYLEDSMCATCNLRQGPYFCREPTCYRYYCRGCWQLAHAAQQHRPLVRNARAAPRSHHAPGRNNDESPSPPMSALGAEAGEDPEWH